MDQKGLNEAWLIIKGVLFDSLLHLHCCGYILLSCLKTDPAGLSKSQPGQS